MQGSPHLAAGHIMSTTAPRSVHAMHACTQDMHCCTPEVVPVLPGHWVDPGLLAALTVLVERAYNSGDAGREGRRVSELILADAEACRAQADGAPSWDAILQVQAGMLLFRLFQGAWLPDPVVSWDTGLQN